VFRSCPIFQRSLWVVVVCLLTACGGGRAPEAEALSAPARTQATLLPPRAAVVDAEACDRAVAAGPALVTYRRVGGECLRSFTGLDIEAASAGARKRPLATSVDAPLTVAELFDWAERAYPQYFPSHQSNRQLATYTYRYYPETQNHVAVSGDLVYVQGPISDGALLFVGNMSAFLCQVRPQSCGALPKDCAAISSWSVGENTCTPNAGQSTVVVSGSSYTYVDSFGSTQGTVTLACSDGTLTQKGPAICDVPPPLACNTAGLSWKVGSNTCSPNPGEPLQMASGTTHTFFSSTSLSGYATYTCNNGELTAAAFPACDRPVAVPCLPGPMSWTVGAATCLPDFIPTQIADGASFTFTDTIGETTGSDTYSCKAGVLQRSELPSCDATIRVQDSFGGDGGAADGGANGDGSAGDGLPIVGGLVRVVDTTGKQVTATTDSVGYYRVKLTGMVPPLVVSVTRTDGVVRRSVSTQALRTNAYIFMAVTGLTDKIASDVARAAGFPGAASLTPAMVAAQPQAVTAAVNALRNDATISAALLAAGLTPSTFDPLYTPFRPNGTGYDKVLDNLVITTDSTGATIVKSVDCPAPASWTVGNATCTPDESDPRIVPSDSTVIFHDRTAPNLGTAAFTCVKSVLSGPILPSCK
jgi:hypothetical protein